MTNNLDEFIKKSKKDIEAFNTGDSNYLLKQEKEKIKQSNKIKNELSSIDYVSEFKEYLYKIPEEYYVGQMLHINYSNAKIITNDDIILKRMGIPKSSFLIATLSDFEKLDGIEHFILLFVENISKMEDDKENQLNLINYYKQTDLKINTLNNEKMLDEKIKKSSYLAIDCKVMGMFYRKDEKTFDFTSQINLMLSPQNYHIAKPNKELRNIIVNHKLIEKSKHDDNDYKGYKIGKYSETETNIFTNENENPDVYIDLNTFRAKRTGFLSKTRLGKSNNAKIILSAFIEDNIKMTNTQLNNKTGFIVFDENGEYANENAQDNTSIYHKYKDLNKNNKEIIKKYTINKYQKDNLMLNFYINPYETMSLFEYLLTKQGNPSIYISSFLNIELTNTDKINEKIINMNSNLLFKNQLFWAILNKAKYKYFNDKKSIFFDVIEEKINNPFIIPKNIMEDLERVVKNESDEENKIFEELKYKDGDSPEIKFHKMCSLIDLFTEIYIKNPEKLIQKEKKKYIMFEPLFEMFNTSNKAGYNILRKYIDFHSEKSNNKIDNLINNVCDNATIAIIDLSTTTNGEVKQYYAQRIVSNIYKRLVTNFNNNETGNKPYVIAYFEEAHNLFPQDANKGGIYYKIAKEGAKYNLGMIYVTQSPSSIYSELLAQTENFFIGHLSSPKEVSVLNSLSFYYEHLSKDIMNTKKIGYMRMVTENNRYPIPVQISKFT